MHLIVALLIIFISKIYLWSCVMATVQHLKCIHCVFRRLSEGRVQLLKVQATQAKVLLESIVLNKKRSVLMLT